jgi:hypothetical protein
MFSVRKNFELSGDKYWILKRGVSYKYIQITKYLQFQC